MIIQGYENWTRAIEFKTPRYLPVDLWLDLGWLSERETSKLDKIEELKAQFPDDMLRGLNAALNATKPVHRNGTTRWTDEWGVGWLQEGKGSRPEIHPLLDGYASLKDYVIPDPYRPERFSKADASLAARAGKYVQALVWFTLFERLWMLRGFNNMLMDPYLEGRNWSKLRDKIVEYNLAIIDQWIERRVHAIFFSDDWGSQQALLMDPDDWRRLYKPAYKAMFDRARSGNAHIWMHLCGNVSSIVGDLIDIGLQVLNPVQPQAMNIKWLSKEYGGKVCFYGGVDVQKTLTHGTPEDVRSSIHELVDLFGKFNGGYIGGTSHTVMPETPLDNIVAMCDAFLQYL